MPLFRPRDWAIIRALLPARAFLHDAADIHEQLRDADDTDHAEDHQEDRVSLLSLGGGNCLVFERRRPSARPTRLAPGQAAKNDRSKDHSVNPTFHSSLAVSTARRPSHKQ